MTLKNTGNGGRGVDISFSITESLVSQEAVSEGTLEYPTDGRIDVRGMKNKSFVFSGFDGETISVYGSLIVGGLEVVVDTVTEDGAFTENNYELAEIWFTIADNHSATDIDVDFHAE